MQENIKPEKIKKDNKQKKIAITLSILTVLLLAGIYLFTSFATFQENKKFNVINGTVEDPGDIYFAYYVDNTITRNLPSKDSGYTIDTSKSNCTNGVTVGWDQTNWTALVNYSNYSATDYTRTKCNLYFKKSAAATITELAQTDTTNLATDDYNNVRYIGADPNNYVSFDGDIWRIIGVMKNIDDGNGNKENRLKIIRKTSITAIAYDSSASSINNGYGTNEWSSSKIMKLLNPGYESETVGGSLYWNSKSGKCYSGTKNSTTSCNFTSAGMNDKLKSLIGNAVWNTGAITTLSQTSSNYYKEKHGTSTGKICTSGTSCNDTVTRTTTWTGKVGLMYPSDYGYATAGGSTTSRATCLTKELNTYDGECFTNQWTPVSTNRYIWTLSPFATSSNAYTVVNIDGRVILSDQYVGTLLPSAYLLSSVSIKSGDGSSSNPYIIE